MGRPGSSSRQKLLRLHRRIHRSLKSEAARLLGETPASIRAYEREFRKDFLRLGRRPVSVTRSELIRAIRRADVTFIADYHTFAQAQRTAIRLAREAIQPGEPWWIGLEMIPSHRQAELDAFQRGELRVEEFLRAIRYDEEWGFPWHHYAPILDWAIARRVPLVALNLPREARLARAGSGIGDDTDLAERDRWATGIITDLFAAARGVPGRPRPHPRMIALYGELHVARAHLPRALREISRGYLNRPLRALSIHQNHEEVYWRLAKLGRELGTEAVRLKRDAYCVSSATPWAKLQSLVSWAEGEVAQPLSRISHVAPGAQHLIAEAGRQESRRESDWDEAETSVDYLSVMQSSGEAVAKFLGLAPPSFESLTPLTLLDAEKLLAELRTGELGAEDRYLARYHVLHNQRIYLPHAEIAYLAVPSENAAAELAAIHLYRRLRPARRLFERKIECFQEHVLQAAFGFLGSLLLNPRRKCDLIRDHRGRIAALRRGEAPAFPHETEARRLALAMIEQGAKEAVPPALAAMLPPRRLAPAVMAAARYYGSVLAKALHRSLMSGEIGVEAARHLCSPQPTGSRYGLLTDQAEIARLGSSKTEQL